MISKTILWLGLLWVMNFGLCSLPAYANFYSGTLLSYSNLEYKHTPSSSVIEENPFLIQGQFGYFFSDYLALEARYATSMRRDDSLAIDRIISGFVKLNMPITERVALYGLGGYSDLQVNQKNLGVGREQGFSFGLGVHYALDKHNAIIFEFVDSSSEEEIRLNALTIGFQHRFQ